MPKVDVYDIKGKKVSDVELADDGTEIEGSQRQDFVFTIGSGQNIFKFDDDTEYIAINLTPINIFYHAQVVALGYPVAVVGYSENINAYCSGVKLGPCLISVTSGKGDCDAVGLAGIVDCPTAGIVNFGTFKSFGYIFFGDICNAIF